MPPRPKRPILIVEDNTETRGVLERLLVVQGYRVATAPDGARALRYLRDGGNAALIVLDLLMPVMDGRDFLAAMRADPDIPHIPVIAYTAVAGSGPLDVVAYVRKTSDPDLLLGLIEDAALED